MNTRCCFEELAHEQRKQCGQAATALCVIAALSIAALFAIHCAVDVRAALAGYLRFSYFTA
jgi:hypothetical protein